MFWQYLLIYGSIIFWVAFAIMITYMALNKEETTTISMKPKAKSKKKGRRNYEQKCSKCIDFG